MTRTVVYYTDSQGFGGAEQVMLTLMQGLDKRRWRPILVHDGHPGLEPLVKRARELGVLTHEFASLPGRRDIGWLLRFRRQILVEEATIFHAHLVRPLACTYGLVAASLARIPVVATQHAFAKILTGHSVRLQRAVSLAVDRYIAVSEQLARDLKPFILSDRKIRVIHSAIPLRYFAREADPTLRASLTGGAARPLVLTVARLDRQKGLSYLIEAAVHVPQAVFVVAGEGSERADLEARARATGVANRIVFLGHRDDIPELLAASDVFVLPSLCEGLGLSVLEAMASGKPVVATKIGGIPEAVEDGVSGLLVAPQDASALAGAIRSLLQDRALSNRLAAAGRERVVERFGAETMVERTMDLYEELTA